MARKSKFAFNFKEMEDLAARIENAGGSLEAAADEALTATHDYITGQLGTSIVPHVDTGDTRDSLEKSARVSWINPMLAKVNIGFNLDKGWPSIFLMWGTPKMKPDMSLRRAAYGPAVRREVAKIQKEAMEAFLQRLGR